MCLPGAICARLSLLWSPRRGPTRRRTRRATSGVGTSSLAVAYLPSGLVTHGYSRVLTVGRYCEYGQNEALPHVRTVRLVVLRGRKRVRAHCVQRRSHATCVCARAIACRECARASVRMFVCMREQAPAHVCVSVFVCVRVRAHTACARQVRYVACKQESRASNGRHADRRVQPPRAVLRGTRTAVRTAGSLGSRLLRVSSCLSGGPSRCPIHPCVASLCAFRSANSHCLVICCSIAPLFAHAVTTRASTFMRSTRLYCAACAATSRQSRATVPLWTSRRRTRSSALSSHASARARGQSVSRSLPTGRPAAALTAAARRGCRFVRSLRFT